MQVDELLKPFPIKEFHPFPGALLGAHDMSAEAGRPTQQTEQTARRLLELGAFVLVHLFAEHRIEEALSIVMSGRPAGGLVDVDGDSDYGSAFASFLETHGSAVTRRTTLVVLGDGRGNGNDPRVPVFEELARRARETVWLTPETRYSWLLGRCDLPLYAEYCDRVQVVRNLHGLDLVSDAAVAGGGARG